MKKNKIILTLLAVCYILTFTSCIKEAERRYFLSANGNLRIDLPDYILSNQTVRMEAYGLNYPTDPQYVWNIGFLTSDTIVGNPISVQFPDTIGKFTISVKASKDGFFDTNSYHSLTVVDTSAATNSLTNREFGADTFVDPRDQRLYHTTKIGNLEWFAENLAWDGVGKQYYNSEVLKYFIGCLYTWNEATGGVTGSGLGNGPQGACPAGWSVPTAEDWEDLGKALNNDSPVDFFSTWDGLGEKISVNAYFLETKMWVYSPDHNHYNMFNFNAIPTGYSVFDNTIRLTNNDYALWWSSVEFDNDLAYYRSIYSQLPDFNVSYGDKKDLRMSVRCVRKLAN